MCVCVRMCLSGRSLAAFEEAAANCTGGNCWPVKKLPISSQSGRYYCIKGCNHVQAACLLVFPNHLSQAHTRRESKDAHDQYESFRTVDGLLLAVVGQRCIDHVNVFLCNSYLTEIFSLCDVLNIIVMNSADL